MGEPPVCEATLGAAPARVAAEFTTPGDAGPVAEPGDDTAGISVVVVAPPASVVPPTAGTVVAGVVTNGATMLLGTTTGTGPQYCSTDT